MKYKFLLLAMCFLVVACNRPMLQPPVTQTVPAVQVTDTAPALTNTAVAPVPKSTQTPTVPRIAATPTSLPTHTPTPRPTTTLKPTSTPYPTPAWCPVETPPPTDSGTLRLVYTSQDKLYVRDEGGSVIQLAHSGNIIRITISDDGQIIAFTRQSDENHAELWVINADGSNERRVVSASELAQLDGSTDSLGVLPTGLMWEPGSHHLIFGTYPVYDGIWIYEPSIYWLFDADTDSLTAAPYHGGYIAYSPDGTQAAIFSMDGLNLVNVDGSNLRENILPSYHGIGEGESNYHPLPFWAPDSTSLLVALPDQDDMYYSSQASVTVWRVPVDGSPENLGQWNAFAPSVQFSPDQTYMAYWLWPQPAKNLRELHLVRLKGSKSGNGDNTIYMSDYLVSDAEWSPDSQHFMISTGDPENKVQLHLGHICQRPQLVYEFTNGWYTFWMDASHYMLEVDFNDTTDQRELHRGKLGQVQLEALGVVTSYAWTLLP